MAKKKAETKNTIKVRALMQLMRLGYGYAEGAEFEIDAALAKEWVKDGYVEECGK